MDVDVWLVKGIPGREWCVDGDVWMVKTKGISSNVLGTGFVVLVVWFCSTIGGRLQIRKLLAHMSRFGKMFIGTHKWISAFILVSEPTEPSVKGYLQ